MLARMIASEGYQVWWDADLPPHMSYGEVITAKIGAAKAAVVVWSETAAASEWVRAEADVARNQKKLIQTAFSEIIPPLPFNQIQCASLEGWEGEPDHRGWTKVKESLAFLCGPPEDAAVGELASGAEPAPMTPPAAAPPPPPSPPAPPPAPPAAKVPEQPRRVMTKADYIAAGRIPPKDAPAGPPGIARPAQRAPSAQPAQRSQSSGQAEGSTKPLRTRADYIAAGQVPPKDAPAGPAQTRMGQGSSGSSNWKLFVGIGCGAIGLLFVLLVIGAMIEAEELGPSLRWQAWTRLEPRPVATHQDPDDDSGSTAEATPELAARAA